MIECMSVDLPRKCMHAKPVGACMKERQRECFVDPGKVNDDE